MDNSPENFNPFSDKSLETVETVEHLPHSYAFESLMYDNRASRVATHDSKGSPFELTREVKEVVGDELDHLFLIREGLTISDLKAQIVDTKNDDGSTQKSVSMSFDTGSMSYKISGNTGQPLKCERENYGEKLQDILIPEDSYDKLLSLFIFNFYTQSTHYKNSTPDGVIDRALNENRFSKEEGLTIALGNYTGESSVRTVSLFDAPEHMDGFMATLEEAESPTDSSVLNKLYIGKIMPSQEKTLHQIHEMYTEDKHESTTGNFIVVRQGNTDAGQIIDPRSNGEEYIKNCIEFYDAISEDLKAYEHLD